MGKSIHDSTVTVWNIYIPYLRDFRLKIWEIYKKCSNSLNFWARKMFFFLNGSEFRQKLIGTIISAVFPTKWATTRHFWWTLMFSLIGPSALPQCTVHFCIPLCDFLPPTPCTFLVVLGCSLRVLLKLTGGLGLLKSQAHKIIGPCPNNLKETIVLNKLELSWGSVQAETVPCLVRWTLNCDWVSH